MQIDISSNIKKVKKQLVGIEKKAIPQATRFTVNNLAFNIARKELPKRADKKFEGGATAWTKRGFGYKKAKRGQTAAMVFIRDNQAKYLKYQIDGGTRTPDKSSILIPTDKARKNKYGNLTRGTYSKIANNDGYFKARDKVFKRVGKKGKTKVVATYKKKATYKPKFKYYNYSLGYVNNPRKGFNATFANELAKQLARVK